MIALTSVIMFLTAISHTIAFDNPYKPSIHQINSSMQKVTENLIGGPFVLIEHTGRVVTERDFQGRYLLIYFGYTSCPDICPTFLQTMVTAYSSLSQEQQGHIAPLFITIDPERDTIEKVHNYVTTFHPSLIGLSGSKEQIIHITRAYRIYSSQQDKSHFIDHSSIIYVMNPNGYYYTHFSNETSVETIIHTLETLPWPEED